MNSTNGKLREFETATASTYDPDEAARAKAIWDAGKSVDDNFYPLPERTVAGAPPPFEKEKKVSVADRLKGMMAAAAKTQAPAATAQGSADRIQKLADHIGGRYVGRRRH